MMQSKDRNKILRGIAVLALYGGLSHAGYSATSDGLSSLIDSEGFTAEQKRALQQTAMAKLASPELILSSTTLDDSKSNRPHIKVSDVSVTAGNDSKSAFVVGKSSGTEIELESVEVSAEEKSKAVGILNKSGGTSSIIKGGNVSVKAKGNSQAYGFVDDVSDW